MSEMAFLLKLKYIFSKIKVQFFTRMGPDPQLKLIRIRIRSSDM